MAGGCDWPAAFAIAVTSASIAAMVILGAPRGAESQSRARWEYKTEPAQNTVPGADQKYNFLGKDGWEMCGADGKFVHFKRPGS